MMPRFVLSVAVVAVLVAATASAQTLCVTTRSLNGRSGPGTSNSVLCALSKGDKGSVTQTSGSWKRLSISTGACARRVVWAHADYLGSCSGGGSKQSCASANVNVRNGPGTSFSIVTTLSKGSKVTELERSGVWVRVSGSFGSGWAHGNYLTTCSSDGGNGGNGGSGSGGAYWAALVQLPPGIYNAGGSTPQGPSGYTYPSASLMKSLYGTPCPLVKDCISTSKLSASVRAMLVTRDVGPFRVTGNKYAVDALKCALDEVKRAKPDLYKYLGTAGMICCRAIRGSTKSHSNHSWGMAIDFKINGKLDPRGIGKAQRGLHEIYPFMHKYGFYWAAGYSLKYEDGMHFEISSQVARRWASSPPVYPRCLAS